MTLQKENTARVRRGNLYNKIALVWEQLPGAFTPGELYSLAKIEKHKSSYNRMLVASILTEDFKANNVFVNGKTYWKKPGVAPIRKPNLPPPTQVLYPLKPAALKLADEIDDKEVENMLRTLHQEICTLLQHKDYLLRTVQMVHTVVSENKRGVRGEGNYTYPYDVWTKAVEGCLEYFSIR